MSVVISEVEHRPLAGGASEASAETGSASAQAEASVDSARLLSILRREASRRSRLWAD